jgi:AcrR family transcriptional regulator
MKEKDVKKRILKAALKEFSRYGFSGSRMERIAKSAKVNKAMIFYYFSSKQDLYQLIIKEVFDRMSPVVMELIVSEPGPEEFLERVTEFYVGIYSQNPDFVRMVVLELIQNPKTIVSVVTRFFEEKEGPPQLVQLIRRWHEQKVITEEDPFQFMLNVVSLSLFSFIAKPFLEALFSLAAGEPPAKQDFNQKRINSVVRLLKRGMLT